MTSFELSALLVTWIAILLLAFGMSGILRQLRALQASRSTVPFGLPSGLRAPRLTGVDDRWPHRSSLLVFMDTACSSCERLLGELGQVAEEVTDKIDLAVVFPSASKHTVPPNVRLFTSQAEAFEQFEVPLVPYAVALREDGVVLGGGPVGSIELLRRRVKELMDLAQEGDAQRAQIG